MTTTAMQSPDAFDDEAFDLDDLDGLDELEGLDAAALQRLLDEEGELLAEAEAELSAAPHAEAPPLAEAPVDPETEADTAAPEERAEEPFAADDATASPPAVASEPPRPTETDPAAAFGELTLVPVPRINIHAFCQDARLTSLVEGAAADRRLEKAHVTIQNGDAFRAAQVFTYEPTPNLLILEAGSSPQELIEGLGALAEVCDPSTQVVVIGELNDINLYRALMERGISDYLVAPKSPLQIVSAIGSLYADPMAAPIGKTYAFVGARGGVGSSSICHSVAWSMAERCRTDTVLMDMDLAFGTASLDFERDPSQGLSEALGAPERLDDVLLDRILQKCTDRLSLFAAPNLLDRDYDLPPESFEQVVSVVRGAVPAIAIDVPHLWTAWAQKQLQTADEVVVTATPDLAAFRNAKNIFETLAAVRGADGTPRLLLNQAGVKGRPEVGADQFEESLGVAPVAVIDFDPQSFGLAATNAQALQEAAPKSKAAAAADELARRLLGQSVTTTSAKASPLKSLFGLLR